MHLPTRLALSGRAATVALTAALLAPPASAGAKTQVACYSGSGSSDLFYVKPSHCLFHRRGTEAMGATTVDVAAMKGWRRWGARSATAFGTYRGNNAVRTRVKVALSERVRCDLDSLYTRVTIYERATGKRIFRMPLPGCPM